MNYLAHALLAQGHEDWIVGSLIADFKPPADELPERVLQGIELHRRVDSLADRSQHFAQIKKILRPVTGLYAGVVADICCDNLLTTQWDRYCTKPLPHFTRSVYQALDSASEHLPMPWRGSSEDWLASYRSREGLERAMLRVKVKVSSTRRFPDLSETFDHYFEHRKELQPLFVELFDDISIEVEHIKARLGN